MVYKKACTDCDRFWSKVEKTDTCWLWTAAKTHNGYGVFDGRKHNSRLVHRISYELIKGIIPNGLDLDHLCRVRHCVNPDHLEAVTRKENLKRGLGNQYKGIIICKHGHKFNNKNTYIDKKGVRHCRICNSRPMRKEIKMMRLLQNEK